MSHEINFAEIKQRISIVQGAKFLGLSLSDDGKTLRTACPVCNGDNRSLSLLEKTNAFKCFKANVYGSVIDLVVHVKGLSLQGAAKWLAEQENGEWLDKVGDLAPEEEDKEVDSSALQPLKSIPKLTAQCDAVKDFGLDPIIAESVGVGLANKGLMKGHIAIPLWSDGSVVGYVGVPKGVRLKLPKNLMVQP